MDDATPRPQPTLHIAVRAEQLWKERRAKGYVTSARQMAEILVAEGYRRVEPKIIRVWVAGWQEAEGTAVEEDNDSLPGMVALGSELVANAKIAIADVDLDALLNGMKIMLDTSNAISGEIITRLPKLKIETPGDVSSLVDTMNKLAEAAERMQRATDHIKNRKIDAVNQDGKQIEAEIVPPSTSNNVRSFAPNSLRVFQQSQMASKGA